MEVIKYNETHIGVLKKKENSKLLEVIHIPIELEDEEAILHLQAMRENDSISYWDFLDFIETGPLHKFTRAFNYCRYLDTPYQEMIPLDVKKEKELYLSRLREFERQLIDAPMDSLDRLATKRKSERRENLSNESYYFLTRRLAYSLEKSTEKLPSEYLAFSHRKIGDTEVNFQLGNDFEVKILSNFGFGSASYFALIIKFKNIEIVPYSFWVKYRVANKLDIIRNTRYFYLHNSEWGDALHFTAECYNHWITSPETFVEKWMINECEEMISGLKYFLDNDKSFKILAQRKGTRPWKIMENLIVGEEATHLMAEKVSGALSFLSQIKTLESISDKVDYFINTILDYNKILYAKLKSEILILELELQELDGAKSEWLVKLDESKAKVEGYDQNLKCIQLQYQRDFDCQNYMDEFSKEINQEFTLEFPEYDSYFIELNTTLKEIDSLDAKIENNNIWKNKFQSHLEVIERHFTERHLINQLEAC